MLISVNAHSSFFGHTKPARVRKTLIFPKKNVSSIADLPDNTVSGTASADRDGRHLSKTWKPQETASAQTDAKPR